MRHLDEGEIHAWLDGAVDTDEARWIEAHIAACAECAAEVATARGLIAGASRILLALDSIPGGVIPVPGTVPSAVGSPGGGELPTSDMERFRATRQTPLRQTPWYARPVTRIAAGLVMAVGIGALATRDRGAASDQVTIDFRTEAGPAASAPGSEPGSVPPSAVVRAAVATATPSRGAPAPAADASGPIGDSFGAAPEERRRTQALATVPPPVAVQLPATGIATAPAAAMDRAAIGAARASVADPSQRLAGKASGSTVAATPPPPMSAPTVANSLSDSSALPRQSRSMRLESVVVTGGVAVENPKLGVAVGPARPAPLGGACFALDVTPPAGSTGIPAVPRRLRIQLEDAAIADADQPTSVRAQANAAPAQGASASLQGSAAEGRAAVQGAAARAFTAPAVQPTGALPWEAIAGDSLVARWMSGPYVVVFRLQLIGTQVKGTAAPEASTAQPSTVTGLRLPCGGGD